MLKEKKMRKIITKLKLTISYKRGLKQREKYVEEPLKQKQASRKEKLAMYLEQKKKLESAKRKNAKPAF